MKVRLVSHRIFQPSLDHPMDFEAKIEKTLLETPRSLQPFSRFFSNRISWLLFRSGSRGRGWLLPSFPNLFRASGALLWDTYHSTRTHTLGSPVLARKALSVRLRPLVVLQIPIGEKREKVSGLSPISRNRSGVRMDIRLGTVSSRGRASRLAEVAGCGETISSVKDQS